MKILKFPVIIIFVSAMLWIVNTPVSAAGSADPVINISPAVFSVVLFLVTIVIGVIAVLGGTGGGVLFTPIMMGFTPINSYIIRATGLFVALAGSLIAARPFLHKGLANTKLLLFAAVPYTVFAIMGALLAGYIQETMGASGSAIVKLALGCLVVGISFLIIIGGRKVEYPQIKKVDGISEKLGLEGSYWEKSLGKVINYRITRAPVGILLFCMVGTISGLFGLGAGWAMVPALNLAMLAPLKIAAASSKVLIGIGDTGAIWPYLMSGAVFPLFLIPSLAGVVVGTSIGTKLMPLVKASLIRWIIIFVLLAAGGKLVYDGLLFIFR